MSDPNLDHNDVIVSSGKPEAYYEKPFFLKPYIFVTAFIALIALIAAAILLDREKEQLRTKIELKNNSLMISNYNDLQSKYKGLFQSTALFLQHSNVQSFSLNNDGSFALRVNTAKIYILSYNYALTTNGITFNRIETTNSSITNITPVARKFLPFKGK